MTEDAAQLLANQPLANQPLVPQPLATQPPTAGPPAVQLHAVSRHYGTKGHTVTALDDVSLTFPRGTFTAVMGPSGSGKSTLLHCAAGLDRPTSGSVRIGGTELTGLSERGLTLLRRDRVGFVFQSFNLLPSLTAEQNVALPLRLAGRRVPRARVREALHQVGLGDRARHRPAQLSGGQQQRVALARALITRPDVLFGDEPTGALDSRTGREVLALLRGMVDREGQTVIMVTHDPVAAAHADQVVFLVDGRPAGRLTHANADTVAHHMTTLTRADADAITHATTTHHPTTHHTTPLPATPTAAPTC
ncbi:MAG: ABC transporter ATP-binding protein [Streptomyces sp.]|nr:ABC transporter ATP-binding protein [Streptomyces sp.]